MTENRALMDEEKSNLKTDRKLVRYKSKYDSKEKEKEGKKQCKKSKQMRKKRLIIRNLSFNVNEEELKKMFSEFGEVLEVKIPVNGAGLKRGFAFVQFKDTNSQIKAMKSMNFKELYGRQIAIDFAVDKTTYQSRQNSSNNILHGKSKENVDSEEDEDEDEDTKPEIKSEANSEDESSLRSTDEEDSNAKDFLKRFYVEKEPPETIESERDTESSDDSDSDETEKHDNIKEEENKQEKPIKKKLSNDVSEGKTIFIRNISFQNTEEDLQEVVQEFGETDYCLLCTDPLTDHSKGTAFVKFKERESADKLVEESCKEPGILLDGRKLICTFAVSREELPQKNDVSQKVRDKRNLRLLKCGLVMYGSKESEGVSQTDMSKRAQLEIVKKQKLRNVNFFVSDTRLAVHNLPKNVSDKDLYILFKKAAGKGAVIKEARVMKDFKKTDAQGIPVSRGFGFVCFTEHESALKALMEINNNPNIFTPIKRPIVEFSIENKVALLTQERKKERIKMYQKRKMEEKLTNNSNQTEETESQSHPICIKKMKNEVKSSHIRKKRKQSYPNNSLPNETLPKTTKKKQKNLQKNKKKKGNMNSQEKDNLSILTNKYKEKLLNKFS